eukprot:3949316-Amphidinium_carterae.1
MPGPEDGEKQMLLASLVNFVAFNRRDQVVLKPLPLTYSEDLAHGDLAITLPSLGPPFQEAPAPKYPKSTHTHAAFVGSVDTEEPPMVKVISKSRGK